jgi:hypothetical protein
MECLAILDSHSMFFQWLLTWYFNEIQFCHLLFRIALSLDLFSSEDCEEFNEELLNGNIIVY